MSYGLYDYDRRYRRRIWGAIIRIGFYLITIGVAAIFAYQIGVEQMETREDRFAARIIELSDENEALTNQVVQLQAETQTAVAQAAELRAAYDRDVPTGIRRELGELVQSRLDDGVSPDRLAFYIRVAREPVDCSEPVTRRFILPTPAYSGANTSVAFADGRITVTGRGENATNEAGGALGWFDPAQQVTINFTLIGGEVSSVEGLLPLHHSIVLEGQEHRFTVVEGDQSLVNVTGDTCELLASAGEDGSVQQ
ncbi:MAG: hypothetical protein RLO50_19665 [Azospirillaceae bacterium]